MVTELEADDLIQSELFSDLTDLDVTKHLLADLHDDLTGKVGPLRYLLELLSALGRDGTILFGGEVTGPVWEEARSSFVHGNFAATVMLCQGLAEHLLAAFLHAGLMIDDLPKRIPFAATITKCLDRQVISEREANDLRRLMDLRNPLSHFRHPDDPTSFFRRSLIARNAPQEHLRQDATFAIGVAVRLLALPAFRVG